MQGFVSPRLGIRFELTDDDLHLFKPNGRKFLSFGEVDAQREAAEARAQSAEARAEALEAKLRALGIDSDI